MASCWRGMGVLLGTCVPSRPTDSHPAHTPTPRVAHPSPTPPSSAFATVRAPHSASPGRSRHHHRHHQPQQPPPPQQQHHHQHHQPPPPPQPSEGPGARYLLVRPATATPPSPRRRHHSRTPVGGVSSHAGGGRAEGRAGRAADVEGTPPLLLLSQALHLPPPPPHLASLIYTYGFKCPICSKLVLPDDLECHLVICLTKPRISYNEDVLTEDKGECVICLEDLCQGDTIARLPCLCIYHKTCIDEWFQVNRSCPEHPYD
ncbi:E3 ubiquitin-protein ligase znrf2-like isoform X3 [Penaeus japonicus]|uniref:E3 ubiquitin-protein ligase znrf2-like isoform X3 n=1 Tax=Penaeus japonicus TaxID=27405 RepID=UPI001C711A86|nr:E3 ubiquitin-protein ligase znrf2-like isoform X3 [Penaeus japonicus]XP_042863486.1 E3 ubiquitin-protein ligase znrf2-like isoform X3 [Penaeus japonicus]